MADFSNTAVGTTESQLAQDNQRFLIFYVEADQGNTDYILFGGQGGSRHRLNAGDVWPLFDVAPAQIFVRSNSGTQKVHGLGTGDPGA